MVFVFLFCFLWGNMRTTLSEHATVPRQSGSRKQLFAWIIWVKVASISKVIYVMWSIEGPDQRWRCHWLYEERESSAGSQLRELTAVSLLVSPVDRKLHTQCWSFVPPLWVTWMGENLICLHLFVILWRGHGSGAILHMYFCTSFCVSSCSYLHIWTHSPLLSFHILPERYPYQKYFGHA